MDKLVQAYWTELQSAVSAWADVSNAAIEDAHRVARGGVPDPNLSARLMEALEAARLHCETVARRYADAR